MPKRRCNSSADSARKKKDSGHSPSSVPAVSFASSKLISADAIAATRLQRVWHFQFQHALTKKYAAAFLNPNTGVTIECVKNMSFEALVVFLREPPRIQVAKSFLQRIHRVSYSLHPPTSGESNPPTINVRVFLAGFMIAYKKSHVFEEMRELETTLLSSASVFVEFVENIARLVVERGSFSNLPKDLTANFEACLFKYLKDFKAWKVPDEVKLTRRICHALTALEEAQLQLPENEPSDSRLSVEFRTQIERLRSKLQQIAGADKLQEYDDSRRAARAAGEQNKGLVRGGVGLKDKVSNEQLAHELMLDTSFELNDLAEAECCSCAISNAIRQKFHQAFYDSLVGDLTLHIPCFVRVVRVLREVRDGIVDIGTARYALEIKDILDIELIDQRISSNAFTWADCRNIIAGVSVIIRQIQAPARDETFKTGWTELRVAMEATDVFDALILVAALKFMLDRINFLRIDAANARLRLIAPVVRVHGVEYQQGKFRARVEDGTYTLERVKNWINESMALQTAQGTLVIQDLVAGRGFQPFVVFSTVSLVVSSLEITESTVPETLALDKHRLIMYRGEIEKIVDMTTVLVSASQNIGTPSPAKRSALIELSNAVVEFWGKPTAELLDKFDQILDSTGVVFPSQEDTARLRRAIETNMERDSAVRRIISERVRKLLITALNTSVPINDAQFITVARAIIPKIQDLVAKMGKMIRLNCTIHTTTYNSLIAEAARALAA